MDEYKPNSYKSKAESSEKKIEKVVSGNVTTRKKSGVSAVKDVLISEDARNVKSYILMDVLVPALKKAISDIVVNGIEMILYGESSGRRKRGTAERVSYRSYYGGSNRDSDRDRSRSSARYSFDDILFENRGEAEGVLDRMIDLIETYGLVSVADMFDLAGLSCNYTDNKYGWTNLSNAEVAHVRDGYIIKLPRAMVVD